MKTFREYLREIKEKEISEAVRPDDSRDKQFKVFIKELEKLYKKTGFAVRGEWFYDDINDLNKSLKYDTDPTSGDITFRSQK